MPSANVQLGTVPLVRFRSLLPGQFGVPGTSSETGLRTDVNGAVFYVDPNATGVSDLRDGTDSDAPLQTVAMALTKCQPYHNDVIAVMANNSWQYGDPTDGRTTAIAEEVTITVPGVRLVGMCPSGMGVYWYPVSNGGTCITVHAIDVTIEGFFFSEGPTYTGCDAIYCEWDGTATFGENLTVRNCIFDDTVDTAIELEFCWYCDLHSCLFQGCADYGIYTDAGGSATAYTTIHDNEFIDCGTAAIALLGGADACNIYDNRIYNGNAEAAAAATDEGINTAGGGTNMISNNFFSCLLPVPANGDWDDLNDSGLTDTWIANYCINGMAVTQPT